MWEKIIKILIINGASLEVQNGSLLINGSLLVSSTEMHTFAYICPRRFGKNYHICVQSST